MNKQTDEPTPSSSDEEQDALRSIADIGPKYADALRLIGVSTPADLLRFTPETLADALREKAGVRVTPDRIRARDWIGQAQKLQEDAVASSDAAAAPAAVDPDSPLNGNSGEWRELGMFTIKFMEREDAQGRWVRQTRVYNEAGTGPEMLFEGQDSARWVEWIFDQMEQSRGAVEVRQTPDAIEVVEEPASFDTVADAAAIGEPGSEEAAGDQLSQPSPYIYSIEDVDVVFDEVDVNAWPESPEQWLEVAARFGFSGEHARELAQERTPFQAEFYLIDLNSQESQRISESFGQMEPEKLDYEMRHRFAMPDPGQYELQTILLLPHQNTKAFRDGPVFHVVEQEPRGSG